MIGILLTFLVLIVVTAALYRRRRTMELRERMAELRAGMQAAREELRQSMVETENYLRAADSRPYGPEGGGHYV